MLSVSGLALCRFGARYREVTMTGQAPQAALDTQVRFRRLDELSGPEIAEQITESAVIIQPIGAVEQHGSHLPLSVDHVIAHESAAALVAEARRHLRPVAFADFVGVQVQRACLVCGHFVAVGGDPAGGIARHRSKRGYHCGHKRLVFLNGPRRATRLC